MLMKFLVSQAGNSFSFIFPLYQLSFCFTAWRIFCLPFWFSSIVSPSKLQTLQRTFFFFFCKTFRTPSSFWLTPFVSVTATVLFLASHINWSVRIYFLKGRSENRKTGDTRILGFTFVLKAQKSKLFGSLQQNCSTSFNILALSPCLSLSSYRLGVSEEENSVCSKCSCLDDSFQY